MTATYRRAGRQVEPQNRFSPLSFRNLRNTLEPHYDISIAARSGDLDSTIDKARLPGVSIVIPVHNEQDNIEPLLGEIHSAMTGLAEFEVIYVDDGSCDATFDRLREATKKISRLRVIRHQENYGQTTAIFTGIKTARFPWVVTLDGDGQNDPADIPLLLDKLNLQKPDHKVQLISGRRRKRSDKPLRRLSSWIANGVRSGLLKDDTPDTGCALKLFSREAFLTLPYFDHMHRFLPALFLRNGGQIEFVDVNHRPRIRGQSNYGVHNRLWVGIVDMFGVMWLQRRIKHPILLDGNRNGL